MKCLKTGRVPARRVSLLCGSLVGLLALGWGSWAQAQTAPNETQGLFVGTIDAMTVDEPGNRFSSGTITVSGQKLVVPGNLLIDVPAARLTLQELFQTAPGDCLTAGQSGLAVADTCTDKVVGTATVLSNRQFDGSVILGDLFIDKGTTANLSGVVTSIDYDEGFLRINGTDTEPGIMVRFNDPTGRHSIQNGAGCRPVPGGTTTTPSPPGNCSPDTRFGLDPDNYTITYTTGYPACIPSTVARGDSTGSDSSGFGDALCPATNRGVSPVPDSTRFAPVQIGDHLTAHGNFEDIEGVRFLSAHTVDISVALTTADDPSQPDYIVMDEVEWDVPGFQNERTRILLIGFSTLGDARVEVFKLAVDPATGENQEFIVASTTGCEVVNGPRSCTRQGIPPNDAGVFKIRYDVDFIDAFAFPDEPVLPFGSPCIQLNAAGALFSSGGASADFREGQNDGPDFVSNTTGCQATGNITFGEEFAMLSPAPREVIARSLHKATLNPGVVTIDASGNEATNGEYLTPVGMGHPEFGEVDLAKLQWPYIFQGLPWNLDRRAGPGGSDCPDGICESDPVGDLRLTPFPCSGLDPRLQAHLPENADRVRAYFPYTELDLIPFDPNCERADLIAGVPVPLADTVDPTPTTDATDGTTDGTTEPAPDPTTDPTVGQTPGTSLDPDWETATAVTPSGASCNRTLTANVVALDQAFFYNRMGAFNPAGMIYALRRDVVDENGIPLTKGGAAVRGKVRLREGKRPRPLVLRMNEGDCMKIQFQNLLDWIKIHGDQPATRAASVHVMGMQAVNSIDDVGANVGANPSALVAPGGIATYTIYAEAEGTFLMYSAAAMTGSEGDGGQMAMGLFGAVNVQKPGAEYYRSQITREELELTLNIGAANEDPANPGFLPSGHPIIDYDAVYPNVEPYIGSAKAGLPVLAMMRFGEIVHSDLNAIITGPGRGDFPAGTYPPNPVLEPNAFVPQAPGLDLRTREEPFREFTAIFHDEVVGIQAFGVFEDPVLGFTLHGGRDGFGINYGVAGVGAEVIANRYGVGPMSACNECKFEEFFLSSWTVGDPAMVVDEPANSTDATGTLIKGAKATKAYYPDDPSNVHHSYIGDHTKIRNLSAGPKEHHIFHLHAHQWVFTPDDDNSTYLDSQSIGPGSNYDYEIAYNGSGNRNQTVGDAIYHCHFYPHFAQGMWAMWRNHDVFEMGTKLDSDGRPAPGSRALPDGEITAGTPIPMVVPIPTLAMAPMPAPVEIVDGQIKLAEITDTGDVTQNPGFPFYVAGVAGHRAPKPPLDTIDDGGLPRHVIVGGETEFPPLNRMDFGKTNVTLDAKLIPEGGTDAELVAMAFHAQRTHPSFTPEGAPLAFVTNGKPPVPGAPFADPCIDSIGNAVGGSIGAGGGVVIPNRTYKAADIQLDVVMNKAGDHYPQARMLSLWEDVASFRDGTRPPEPMFFRANTNDCIEYQLANLIPGVYELDDFQVRTPTDVVGQHIHLVKFDVTASDGSANGWNYEDGSFSPDEVIERIAAINVPAADGGFGGMLDTDGTRIALAPVAHPFFGTLGAQTTVQRWFADDVLNNAGEDRTLTTVYTHDHFAPSTHQQIGLYAGLLIEPEGSTWVHNETGEEFYTRPDGGPTSWQAAVLTGDINGDGADDSYREFMMEFIDFQLAYKPGPLGDASLPGNNFVNTELAINPPGKEQIGLPFLVERAQECPGFVAPPCPEIVSADDPGTFSVNYRNEPLAYRIRDPQTNAQADGLAGDLSHAYRSDIVRADPLLNVQPDYYPPLTGGLLPGDPYTPLMRTYEGDRVQFRVMVGAHEEGHIASVHGTKWLQEARSPDSGWRNAQMMGISEHFEFDMKRVGLETLLASDGTTLPQIDYLYKLDTSSDGQWNGIWGLMRTYSGSATGPDDLFVMPNNVFGLSSLDQNATDDEGTDPDMMYDGICPVSAPVRAYKVVAITAAQMLPQQTLVYNSRAGAYLDSPGPLQDPTGILYVRAEDIEFVRPPRTRSRSRSLIPKLKTGVPIEPLILRANAGDCIKVTLINALPLAGLEDLDGYDKVPMQVDYFNLNEVRPSNHIGLHAQRVAYDMSTSDGANVGLNPVQTISPIDPRLLADRINADVNVNEQGVVNYTWYAGDISVCPDLGPAACAGIPDGTRIATPIEFGGINLIPSDPIEQSAKGLIAALIIEPEGSTWAEDATSRASATVTKADGVTSFREFVVLLQDDVQLRDQNGVPICPVVGKTERQGTEENEEIVALLTEPGASVETCGGADDAEDSGNKAVNYRSEPVWFRIGFFAGSDFGFTGNLEMSDTLSNSLVGGDPETPVFTAPAGSPVRFRVLQPGGHPRNGVFEVQGHGWQREPYVTTGPVGSEELGDNPKSQYYGAQAGLGPANHFEVILENGAGGAFQVPGDYLWRNMPSFQFDAGMWGILRVEEPAN